VRAQVARPAATFAYPNGNVGDYDARAIRILEREGIGWSVTSRHGLSDHATPRHELRRFLVGGNTTQARFELMISGITRWW
jgi:peptidoglycan/xylan/chitin deacetylase (PgdA/CDA1 family)